MQMKASNIVCTWFYRWLYGNSDIFSLHHEIADILPRLVAEDKYVECDVHAYVPIKQVLANPWNRDRMEEARQLLREGKKPPPILVVRYFCNDDIWYVLIDGNHRVAAARESGLHDILAHIYSDNYIQPEYPTFIHQRLLQLQVKLNIMISHSLGEDVDRHLTGLKNNPIDNYGDPLWVNNLLGKTGIEIGYQWNRQFWGWIDTDNLYWLSERHTLFLRK